MIKEEIRLLFSCMVHPFDTFYEMRHREKGSVITALIVVMLTSLAYSLNRRYASFVVLVTDRSKVNTLTDMLSVFALFFLFCIGNWSVTCLLNGEGRIRDIIKSTGYALFPIPVLFTPAILLSQYLAQNEEVFYSLLVSIGVLWAVLLAITGNMIMHNFSLAKELAILLLTVVAMMIMLFIVLLFYSLYQQMFAFFESIYTELLFRI